MPWTPASVTPRAAGTAACTSSGQPTSPEGLVVAPGPEGGPAT